MSTLSNDEIRRYGRHLTLPEVGLKGQERLRAGSVLLVGAGGLGSPLALYLAAAGVGRIGVVDDDVVEETNLQRQVLYGNADLGHPKTERAAARMLELNPHIEVEEHRLRLVRDNALEIVGGYDVVVDGSDNFATRYLVNDACVLASKPNVYGSIFRFEGQVSVFWGEHGPCYRCLFAEPPPPGAVPSCAEGGVLGVLPGIIGSLQANEALKLLLGIGEPLIGRLVLFDALKMRFRELALSKDPDCPVCSAKPTVTELIDYEAFCGVEAGSPDEGGEMSTTDDSKPSAALPFDVTVEELKSRLDAGESVMILDVRTQTEADVCCLEGSTLLPLQELADRVTELDRGVAVVAHCHHGMRSAQAVAFLRRQGFDRVQNLAGGIDAWSERIDPTVPRY